MIRTDSRKIESGDTFVALDGISGNGADYIGSAISKGASKIVCRAGAFADAEKFPEVVFEYASDPRTTLEEMLVAEYGDVISHMHLIGVTGTNGKTTTCYLLHETINAMNLPGVRCAYIGTIGFYMDGKVKSLPNTTVDICELYALLLEAHAAGYDYVALEASSQGLDMGRLHTITFDAVAFTNLTEDHLDYHGTMENYARAKQIILSQLKDGAVCAANADDAYYKLFQPEGYRHLTFGFGEGSVFQMLDFGGEDMTRLRYKFAEKIFEINTRLIGDYNMYNLMTVVALLYGLGFDLSDINKAAGVADAPDGRMDRIDFNGNKIVIDYAHTPDAMEKIIAAAKGFTAGKIFVIFGCTGDREREKRPVMTKIALSGCDFAIITVDDLHSEDPQQIFEDMLAGNELTNYKVVEDRREAIREGLELLTGEDTLLVLGKGHENFIVKDGGNIPHNDKKAVLELMDEAKERGQN